MRRLVSALLAAIVVGTLPSAAALAKTPPGPSSLAIEPVLVDAHLGYQKQKTCSPSAKPGTKALLSLLIKTWGGSSWGISRSCNVGGASEHKEGRALDWHKDVRKSKDRKAVADAVKWLTANNGEVAYRLGIMYIIWDQKIWSIYYQELGWRKMASRGSRTANHKDHVHISLSWDGAMKQTSWWTGVPVTQPLNRPCGATGTPVCLPSISRSASVWQTSPVNVPPFLPAPWSIPGIGGSPQVGRVLTAVAGTWVPPDSAISYQWLADGQPIPAATSEHYLVQPGTVGRAIKVRVTALSPGGTTLTKTSDGTSDVVRANFRTAPVPVILGPRTTGTLLSVGLGTWNPVPTAWAYQWYRSGKKIKGATRATYRLVPADLGKKITVKVTGKASGFNSRALTSKKTAKVTKGQLPVSPIPQVSGTLVLGNTLTLIRGTWGPAPVKYSYQWYRNGVAIPKATKATYRLTGADVGTVVRVRVRGTRSGYLNTYRSSSSAVPVVAAEPPPPSPDPTGATPPVLVTAPSPDASPPTPEVTPTPSGSSSPTPGSDPSPEPSGG